MRGNGPTAMEGGIEVQTIRKQKISEQNNRGEFLRFLRIRLGNIIRDCMRMDLKKLLNE